ncbi:MAG: energy-coupling factor ABC transporter ATP-binding protein [Candidatus Margulisiibacteriota bacterium]
MEKAVEITGLSYTYPEGAAALLNIDLDIFEGESVGLIGPNGCGKSTLLLNLNGILKGEGSIKVFGTIGTDLQEFEGEIICLDGPTLNLDAKHRRQVIELIREREGTKIIATHDLDLVFETCSRVILMNAGEIIRQGNAMEILGDKVLLEENDLEQPERFANPKNPGFYPLGDN